MSPPPPLHCWKEAPWRWAIRDTLNVGTWLSSPMVGSSQKFREAPQADSVPPRLTEETGSSYTVEESDMAKYLHLKVLERGHTGDRVNIGRFLVYCSVVR